MEREQHKKSDYESYLLPVCNNEDPPPPLSAIWQRAALLCMHNEHEKYHILLQPPRYYTKFYKAAKNLKKNWIMKCISLSGSEAAPACKYIYILSAFFICRFVITNFFPALFQE
jgi:hypothetical protein